MLVLKRRHDERIQIRVGDQECWITVVEIGVYKATPFVRLGFEAAPEITIMREELLASAPTPEAQS